MAQPYLIMASDVAVKKAFDRAWNWISNKSGAYGPYSPSINETTHANIVAEFLLNEKGQTLHSSKAKYGYQPLT